MNKFPEHGMIRLRRQQLIRVARLAQLPPIGRFDLFSLGSFFAFGQKNMLGYTLGDFVHKLVGVTLKLTGTNPFRAGRGPLAVHAAASARLPRRVLGRVRRVHALPGRLQRVLQPAPPLGPLHHRQHLRLAHELQADRQNQRQHLATLHLVPGANFFLLSFVFYKNSQ
jgi:hypothetical protein